MDAATIPATVAGCSICSSPVRATFINERLDGGVSPNRIEHEAKAAGIVVKSETVARHNRHRTVSFPGLTEEELVAIRATPDFAEAVAAAAARSLVNGTTKVSISDGLKATTILDKRAEKAENRRFLMNLAQLLSGGGQPAPKELISGDVVEGDFTDLDNPLLAPLELRE